MLLPLLLLLLFSSGHGHDQPGGSLPGQQHQGV
jgi:hypothetical protein